MFEEDNADSAVAFARDFLDRYTAVGFGALSKREVDLLLIQLLQRHLLGFHAKSDFDAALMLRTTKRKIRGLRDEVSFRDARDENYLNTSLRQELKRAEVLPSDLGMIKIQLDDAVLRGYAEKIVRSEYGIVDSSFNSAILQLSGEKYLLLCLTVLTPEERDQAQQALAEIRPPQPQEDGQQETLFTRFKDAFVAGAGQQAGKLCVSGAMALVTGGASIILETSEPLTEAGRGIGRALQQSWEYFTQDQQVGE
ncbi:hypothetical protein [Flavimaricola marinus]|uniref:Uncharacterized protein n=1 Tax=Flavimaricola marinus TaxID=1819565 RepID=A0A238LCA4_9RHOB|nr:hypothetical protein [Flavimaricola marinus]SMY07251.1 hypothetical protein LOM8899_01384 [Flavimaricola marinus]